VEKGDIFHRGIRYVGFQGAKEKGPAARGTVGAGGGWGRRGLAVFKVRRSPLKGRKE